MSHPTDRPLNPGRPFMATSRALFDTARGVAEGLLEDGYSWAEIEHIAHFLLSTAKVERHGPAPQRGQNRG